MKLQLKDNMINDGKDKKDTANASTSRSVVTANASMLDLSRYEQMLLQN